MTHSDGGQPDPQAGTGSAAIPTPRVVDPARRRARIRLVVLLVTALAGAGALAGAAGITWWTAHFDDQLSGVLTTTARGSTVLPELVPVALVALAGIGATLATRGWARRAVGVLVVIGGLLVVVRAGFGLAHAPAELFDLPRPATQRGAPTVNVIGAVLAIIGGLLVAVSGGYVIGGAGTARGMGSRYTPPSRRADRSAVAAGQDATSVDPAVLWRALDAGADPTDAADPPSG